MPVERPRSSGALPLGRQDLFSHVCDFLLTRIRRYAKTIFITADHSFQWSVAIGEDQLPNATHTADCTCTNCYATDCASCRAEIRAGHWVKCAECYPRVEAVSAEQLGFVFEAVEVRDAA